MANHRLATATSKVETRLKASTAPANPKSIHHICECPILFNRMPDNNDAEPKYFVRKWYLPESFRHILRPLE